MTAVALVAVGVGMFFLGRAVYSAVRERAWFTLCGLLVVASMLVFLGASR